MFVKHPIKQGVNLYTRQTDQFKTVTFAIKFTSELCEKAAAARSVLANVLEHSNHQYQTESALRKKLDDLYGTVLFTDVRKRGTEHIVSLNVECVNEDYLNEEGILNEAIALMKIVLFEPNLKEGQFEQSIVNREKRTVIERIRSRYDNKTSYAQHRLLTHLRPNSAVSTSANGTIEMVEKINPKILKETYLTMIEEDAIDIYVVGNIEQEKVLDMLGPLFSFNARPIRKITPFQNDNSGQIVEVERVNEQQNMQQGKLHLAYCTPISFTHKDYPKMQVTNGVFGAFPHSKLFMNVREKESMAYYASSSYASHYGLIFAIAGIDASLADKAVQLIEEQLQALKNGEISDLEINQTKALLKNGIRSAFDSARGQIEVYDQYKALDENFTADTLILEWENVTKEDVQKMAKTIQLEMVYLLSGKEKISNEENPL